MSMNGPLARAARALIQWPRSHVAKIAELDEETLARFEAGGSMLAASELTRLRDALERGGAVFIDEDHRAGSGVRLKFNAKDVRAINRMEGEGGPVGTDDVYAFQRTLVLRHEARHRPTDIVCATHILRESRRWMTPRIA